MIAGTSVSLASELAASYRKNLASQTAILGNLTDLLTPIAEAGPNQTGFSPQELAAYKTQATEGVGRNYAKASAALNNQLAVRGGGNQVLPSGADAQLKEELASQAATLQSQEDLAITRANYAQGRQNWTEATHGLAALSAEYNPTAFGSLATGANQGAFKEATKIQDMKNQAEAEIAGGVVSLGMDAATFGAGALGVGGSPGGFGGGLAALANPDVLKG